MEFKDIMNKKRKYMKTTITWALGVAAFVAFLTLCSEPAPGNDIDLGVFLFQKLIGAVVLVGSIIGISKVKG